MHKLIIAFIFLLLMACSEEKPNAITPDTITSDTITIEDAWIREAPPNASAMSGYMTINNNTAQDRILTFAKSKDFKAIEVHRTIIEDGMAKMRHQDELLIPAGTSLVFKPGDFHLMMMGPKTALQKNDEVAITLCFKNADVIEDGVIEEIDITMPVKKPQIQ